jgi:acyl-coenzyme A thioesterase PaaI-like protein
VTDIPAPGTSLPSRLGVTARPDEGGRLVLDLEPQAEALQHGVVRASVLSFVVDAVAGIAIDDDPDAWWLTSDLSVRTRPEPATTVISGVSRVLRHGGRSVTCAVELTAGDGSLVGAGAAGFARVRRREGDPPKPLVTPDDAVQIFRGRATLSLPLREEAGIQTVDAAAGVVEVDLTAELLNPAGTMQGAMVALVAEAAAEDLAADRADGPVVVTDLDLRYLARTGAGPVRTRSRLLGDRPDSPIEVHLVDESTGTLTTLVYARAVPV